MCKVSVLIPAYNVQPFIRDCLDSVLRQTLSDIEVICVDDASTDGTLSVLREYEALDSRVRVYCHEENLGQSCGRNLALSHAVGEYIYMLDADDMILPEALEELYKICTEDMLDAAGFESQYFTEDKDFWQEAAMKPLVYEERPVMDGRKALVYCMENESFSLSVPTFIMKRSYLEEIGLLFTERILHEDVGYLFELICRAGRIRFLHRAYFLRRIRAQSTMTKPFTAANIEGYLKSFARSFELEPLLEVFYEEDLSFRAAVKKWQRDIFGRLRQLYSLSEDAVYHQNGKNAEEGIRWMFELVKLTTAGKAQAKDILGEEACSLLESLPAGAEGGAPQVYICGAGQYAERAIDLIGALGLVIKGVLVTEKSRNAFRGYPVYHIREAEGRAVPVIMGVSHYKQGEYEDLLAEAGYTQIIYVRF